MTPDYYHFIHPHPHEIDYENLCHAKKFDASDKIVSKSTTINKNNYNKKCLAL